ncbi:D-alanyl-D-alanine carboxypeptidase, partial [human gut metagenome]
MASTTKIMTLIIALENCDKNFVVTTSAYAASMPDVQLNAVTGEQFIINDLYYSLMLESHNDS